MIEVDGVSWSFPLKGPATSALVRFKAIALSMMVVMTSCPFRYALMRPAGRAHIAPVKTPTAHPATTPSGPPIAIMARLAKQAPTVYCPSAPMLKSPALRAKYTADPRIRRGDISLIVPDIFPASPSEPVKIVETAAAISALTTSNDKTMTMIEQANKTGTFSFIMPPPSIAQLPCGLGLPWAEAP